MFLSISRSLVRSRKKGTVLLKWPARPQRRFRFPCSFCFAQIPHRSARPAAPFDLPDYSASASPGLRIEARIGCDQKARDARAGPSTRFTRLNATGVPVRPLAQTRPASLGRRCAAFALLVGRPIRRRAVSAACDQAISSRRPCASSDGRGRSLTCRCGNLPVRRRLAIVEFMLWRICLILP